MLADLLRRKRPRSEMTFLEHVEDLRVSVMRVAIVFALGFFAALVFYREMPEFLRLPLDWAKAKSPGMATFGELREFTFMGVWSVLMYTAASVGIALASPVLDCFTIGAENRQQLEDLLTRIPKASVRG